MHNEHPMAHTLAEGVEVPIRETPAEDPAPLTEEEQGALKFKAMMASLEQTLGELKDLIGSERMVQSVVAALSCDTNFIRLVRALAQEVLAEAVLAHNHEHEHPRPMFGDLENVIRAEAVIAERPTDVKAALTASDHPTHPNAIEAYVLHGEGTEVNWVALNPTPLVATAIRDALVAIAAQPYEYKFMEIRLYTQSPLNEDSVHIPAETSNDDESRAAGSADPA